MSVIDSPAEIDAPVAAPQFAAWYADPVDGPTARAQLDAARRALVQCYSAGADGFDQRVQALIAGYWLGQPIHGEYQAFYAVIQTADRRALLDLIYGQLLIARRLTAALTYLDRGFHQAATLLAPADYFLVLKRHALLRQLALWPDPQPPRDLETLRTEARVIVKLRGGTGRCGAPGVPTDTLG